MKTNDKLTTQDFLDMPLEDLKKLTINDFVELCNKNNLDFADVIKQIKYKFDVQDSEMQNKQTIYSNLKDNVAIVQDDANAVSLDEYAQIHKLCTDDEQKEKFIMQCLQSGISLSRLQRYYRIGFNKAARVADKLVFDNIAYRDERNCQIIDRNKFIEVVVNGEILNV